MLTAANVNATGTGELTLNGNLNVGSGFLELISGTDGSGNRLSESFTNSSLAFSRCDGRISYPKPFGGIILYTLDESF